MRRGRILILLGLILAIGTAIVVFVMLQGVAQPTPPPEIERTEVVYAVQPIAAGEPVQDRLGIKEIPSEGLPETVLRSLDGTASMFAAIDIEQDTIIYQGMILTAEEMMLSGTLSQLVEPGYVAMGFPIDELSSVSYGVQPGDHIDVLMTFPFIDVDQEYQIEEPLCPPTCPAEGEEGLVEVSAAGQMQRLVAQLTVQDVVVLGVGRWNYAPVPTEEEQAAGQEAPAEPQPPRFVTLMVQPQDALVLKLANEYGASIDLAVRADEDLQEFVTQEVTLDYILARFVVSLPARQPYTIQELERRVAPPAP